MCDVCCDADRPCCDIGGRCEAPVSPVDGFSVCNCFHCGKELEVIDGCWYTWDHGFVKNPLPQKWREIWKSSKS